MGTENPPTAERLNEFYRRYDEFRPAWYRSGAASGALAAQYKFYADYVSRSIKGSWADVGAGHGEVANILATQNPIGCAIDIGTRPDSLSPSLAYKSIDMNEPGWGRQVGRQFDSVFSVAVWEHVLAPEVFARECLSLLAPSGCLTLVCPDYGSAARKMLGQNWPYFEPGEHISIPSREGARRCLCRAMEELGIAGAVNVARLNVGYSLKYLFNVLRMRPIAAFIPAGLAAPLPTGILSARVELH